MLSKLRFLFVSTFLVILSTSAYAENGWLRIPTEKGADVTCDVTGDFIEDLFGAKRELIIGYQRDKNSLSGELIRLDLDEPKNRERLRGCLATRTQANEERVGIYVNAITGDVVPENGFYHHQDTGTDSWVKLNDVRKLNCVREYNLSAITYSEIPRYNILYIKLGDKKNAQSNTNMDQIIQVCKATKIESDLSGKAIFLNLKNGDMRIDDNQFQHARK